MDLLRDVLLFLHFIGLAALFGGLFVQVKARPRVVNNAMFHGILTQLVTGVLLVGVLQAGDHEVDNAKIGVKLLVALVIGALVLVNRKKSSLPDGLYLGLLGLTKPTDYGGMALDYSYSVVMAEALGHIDCGAVPMAIGVQTDMATPALARFGSDELRRQFLAPAIAGA